MIYASYEMERNSSNTSAWFETDSTAHMMDAHTILKKILNKKSTSIHFCLVFNINAWVADQI